MCKLQYMRNISRLTTNYFVKTAMFFFSFSIEVHLSFSKQCIELFFNSRFKFLDKFCLKNTKASILHKLCGTNETFIMSYSKHKGSTNFFEFKI